jgi:uncharacterized protein
MQELAITDNHLGCIRSASGTTVDLRNPTIAMIKTEDIAVGLNNICRFGGQINNFYSVLSHSILVMVLAPPSLWKAALLHDAAEAYLGDVVTPLKNILGAQYRELEQRFMSTICMKYRISQWELDQVKEFDKKALLMEDECLRKNEQWFFLQQTMFEKLTKRYPEFTVVDPMLRKSVCIVFQSLLKNG